MKRRSFLKSASIVSAAAIFPPVSEAKNSETGSKEIYELREYQLTGGGAKKQIAKYITSAVIPLLNSHGVKVGVFEEFSLEDPPKLYTLFVFPSFDIWKEIQNEFVSNEEYLKNAGSYLNSDPTKPLFTRYNSSLLEAFSGFSQMKQPGNNRGLFELRTYEGYNEDAVIRKIKMFNTEEIPLFEKVGLHPIFFGKILTGKQMPALTYMLWFDNMDERNKNWDVFRTSEEWNTMKVKSEYANTVSKVNKKFLLPTEYSQV